MAYTLPTAASSTVEYEDFYESTLAQPLGVSDTDIYPVNMPASAVGFLVIDANGTTPEIVFYNTKGASYVRCPSATDGEGRGVFQTTPRPYEAGTKIGMYSIAAFFEGIVTGRFMRDEFLQARHFSSTLNVGQWAGIGSACIAVTNEGNRSSTLTFASSVASKVSPGMRLLLEKTVPGNAYMGGIFNATNQYFTVSPTGALATITNNFTLMAHIMPTAYVDGIICGRSDAASNNALELRMVSNGTLAVYCFNGGVGNYRAVFTYQSVSLNKKSHVAVTWASGAVALYIDGISVPVTGPTTSGTAPTTAGTGGDWSVGRKGAYAGNYFAGYISNVAVFNAALTASLIRQYSTYKSSSSEPSCIGAWSLDNTAVNQVAAGTNDLTAMNSVGYTAASPHGQLSNYIDASKAIALVMAVNGSTVTVQTPEGVTIPTTGGITAVSYATSGVPFGWVVDEARWMITSIYRITSQQTSPAAGTWYNPSSRKLNIPTGTWKYIGHTGTVSGTAGGGSAPYVNCSMGTSPSSSGIAELNHLYGIGVANIYIKTGFYRRTTNSITLAAATDYYENVSMEAPLCASVEALSCDLFALPAGI